MFGKIIHAFLITFLSSALFADESVSLMVKKPSALTEGIERKLTPEQINELLPWAKDSKIYLTDLVSNVETLGTHEKITRLQAGIAEVVAESAPANNELFMRYALNRSLVIIQILEKEIDAKTVGSDDVKLRILNESIAMAVKLFDKDSSPSSYSVASFGADYFKFLTELSKSIFDATAQYAIYKTALEFYQWDLYRDLASKEYAATIVKIQNVLRSLPESMNSDREAIANIRILKKVTREVSKLNHQSSIIAKCVDAKAFDIKHSGTVRAASFSPDGRYVVTGSEDNSARITEVATGRTIHEISHGDSVIAASFSSDGRYVVTGSYDNTARITEVETGRAIRKIQHDSGLFAASFSPDGRYVVTGGVDSTVRITEVETGRAIREIKHNYFVRDASFSPDGRNIMTVLLDDTAQIAVVETGRVIRKITHKGGLRAGSFSPDGRYVVTGSLDNTARIIEVETGRVIREIKHKSGVQSASFSPDGHYVVAGLNNGAQITEVTTGKVIREIEHGSCVYTVSFSPDGRYVITGSGVGVARITDLTKE